MLRLFITTFSVILVTTASGQVNKGAILLGGDISYFSVEYEEPDGEKDEAKTFQFSPSIATALKNNLVFGVNTTYSKYKLEEPSMLWFEEAKAIGGGVFIRQYHPIAANFFVIGQATLSYVDTDLESGSLYNQIARSTKKESNINLSVMPGLSYKAGKKLFLEWSLKDIFKIEFTETKTTAPSLSGGSPQVAKRNDFSISSSAGSIPVNIGMRFIFNN